MLRWIKEWRRRRNGGVSLNRETPRATPGQRDASQALHRSECARRDLEDQQPEVEQAATRLRDLRATNGFAEMIRLSVQGGR